MHASVTKLFLGTVLLSVSSTAAAEGGPFAAKTMREAFPAREIERPLSLPKGWVELTLGVDQKNAIGAWSPEGERDLFESTEWTYRTEYALVRYGLAQRWELWWQIPVHQAHLVNSDLGTDTRDGAVGDARFGARFKLYDAEPPRRSVVAEVGYKGPSAPESPGTYIGGPQNVSGFVFTTGTPDLSIGVAGKQQFGPAALTVRVGYVRRFSSVVQYLIEMEELQFLGRINPGDQLLSDVTLQVQGGPVVLFGGAELEYRGTTQIGTTSGGWNPARNLDDVPGSSGNAIDATAGVQLNLSRGVDLEAHALFPVKGEDLQFFPIEDLQPTLGPTYGGSVELRY
jgi:hypothetical protein